MCQYVSMPTPRQIAKIRTRFYNALYARVMTPVQEAMRHIPFVDRSPPAEMYRAKEKFEMIYHFLCTALRTQLIDITQVDALINKYFDIKNPILFTDSLDLIELLARYDKLNKNALRRLDALPHTDLVLGVYGFLNQLHVFAPAYLSEHFDAIFEQLTYANRLSLLEEIEDILSHVF